MKDLADITMGQSPAGSSMNERTGMEFHQGKTNFGSVFLNCSKVKTNAPTKMANKDDIVICVRAPVGVVNITNRKICIGRGLAALSPKELVDRDYLFYALQASQKAVEKLAAGSTFSSIPGPELCKLELPKQTYEKQKSIGRALSSADKAIAILEKQISKYENIKKSTINLLLKPNKDWETVKIKDVFTVTRGLVLSTTEMSKHKTDKTPFPVYSSQTQNNGLIGFYSAFLYQDAITWTTDGANAGFVRFRPGKFYCTNVCGVLLSEKGHANACIATILGSVSKKYVSYVGNPKLMNNVMAEIPISIPPIDQQKQIAQKLSAIDEHISNLKLQLKKQQDLKQGLMQYFFGD